MTEIKNQTPFLGSITPDIQSRIKRAFEITKTIDSFHKKQTSGDVRVIFDPTKTAENLGIYDGLGVSREEIKAKLEGQFDNPDPQTSLIDSVE